MSSMLITGAAGFIGSAVCRALTKARIPFLGIDRDAATGIVPCDLRNPDALESIFNRQSFGAVIHLAAMLPGAAALDPISAIDINARASVASLERSIAAGVRRFVFGSSTSVYGAAGTVTPVDESVPAAPIDVYGASKRLVEIVGESMNAKGEIEFVSLRIATVIGPGARHTSSPWRSEIFEKLGQSAGQSISLPYSAEDPLTVVHVDDVAQMLLALATADGLGASCYNTPAELCTARDIKTAVEGADPNLEVNLTGRKRPLAPLSDGQRFAFEFCFEIAPMAKRMQASR
jgi:nucleoside-diphosphate-sugar epimerase